MKEWMIAFNNAKTLETNGVASAQIIEEYERVMRFLASDHLSEAETRVWNEVCRNLFELYALEDNEGKANYYNGLKKECGAIPEDESEETE